MKKTWPTVSSFAEGGRESLARDFRLPREARNGLPLTPNRDMGSWYYHSKELNSAIILSEQGNRLSPRASRKEFSPVGTLILALWELSRTSNLQNCVKGGNVGKTQSLIHKNNWNSFRWMCNYCQPLGILLPIWLHGIQSFIWKEWSSKAGLSGTGEPGSLQGVWIDMRASMNECLSVRGRTIEFSKRNHIPIFAKSQYQHQDRRDDREKDH